MHQMLEYLFFLSIHDAHIQTRSFHAGISCGSLGASRRFSSRILTLTLSLRLLLSISLAHPLRKAPANKSRLIKKIRALYEKYATIEVDGKTKLGMQALGVFGAGNSVSDDQALIDALTYVGSVANQAAWGRIVVNMSIGGAIPCPAPVNAAITTAVGAGIPVIVSAGNYVGSSSGGAVQSPGNCTDAMPVGATDALDNVAGFSGRGAELAARGVVAPGVSVMTTDLNNAYAAADGTSFSAPIVSGLAALILSNKPGTVVASGAGNNEVMNIIRSASEGIGG